MSVSIRGCPACNAMLLGDSAQCPHCGHVLDASRASSEFLELIPASELQMSEADEELPCRQCGEMVRLGLVRCWACGAFTNPEIEAKYQRMQANPSPIMFSDISNAVAADAPEDAERFSPQYGGSDDGGFELQDGYHFATSGDDDFSVAPEVAAVPAAAKPVQTTSAQYGYQAAAADDDFSLNNSAAAGFIADQYGDPPAADTNQAQAAYDQAAYDQYQQQYGDQQATDGTGYAIDAEAWRQAGYDPNAQPGEPGYYDPNAAYDPNTGYAYDPNTGYAYDPNTGYAYDPNTGYAYDPNTGYAYDPNTGQAYDPNAAYEPGATQHDDPNASQEGYATQEAAPPEETTTVSIPELPGTAAEIIAAQPVSATSTSSEMPPAPDVAHSVSTGGEALFAAAIEEEKQSLQIRKAYGKRRVTGQALAPGAFLIFCPNGHKVQVHDRHRGRAGRCPNCKAVFFVPAAVEAPTASVEGQAGPAAADPRYQVGAYTSWLFELRLHTVNPTKVKLKPGAMAGEYDIADIAFSDTEMLVATVFKRAGAFAAMQEKKKKPATRLAISDFLQTKKPMAQLPVPFQTVVTANDAGALKIVQPAAPGEESIFVGIPVFGPGRIVVRLPAVLDGGSRAYLSFTLSEFREFARLLERVFGIVAFGQELGIPLTDITSTYKCHYSDVELQALENVEYYQNDPALKPVVIGRKCAGCGLVVSEDARKKEKIGGKTDVSVAKATCPKCKKKFGDKTFFGLDPNAKPIVLGMLPKE
ncbi:MAG: hypothetical protein JWM11_1366 [Planctomycetaceae bacterium]|nr:hypothetical protein [Planctomycetaceae bacterium]